jgi:hypothetical protein
MFTFNKVAICHLSAVFSQRNFISFMKNMTFHFVMSENNQIHCLCLLNHPVNFCFCKLTIKRIMYFFFLQRIRHFEGLAVIGVH